MCVNIHQGLSVITISHYYDTISRGGSGRGKLRGEAMNRVGGCESVCKNGGGGPGSLGVSKVLLSMKANNSRNTSVQRVY